MVQNSEKVSTYKSGGSRTAAGRFKWSSVLQEYDRIPFKPGREYKGIAVVPRVNETSTFYELFEGLHEAISGFRG